MGFSDSDAEHKEANTGSKNSGDDPSNSQTINYKVKTNRQCDENNVTGKYLSSFSSKTSEMSCNSGVASIGDGSSSPQSTVDYRTGIETPQTPDHGTNVCLM